MKLKNPKIVLQRPGPYQPGDLLEGSVTWRLERAIKVKHIRLVFAGNCKVKWTKGSGDDEKTYKSREVYFQHFITLHGSADGQDVSLAVGEYTKSFRYQLPRNLPSSFSSSYGNVWYTIMLQAEYSGVFSADDEYIVGFTIMNPVLNHNQRPIRIAKEEVSSGCFGGSSTIKFEVVTDKSMYRPGEPITLNGYVMNGGSDPLQKVKLIITQNLFFYGRRTGFFGPSGRLKSKQKNYIIAEWKGEQVPARGRLDLHDRATVRIPNVVESDLKHCQFIDVQYCLTFKAVTSGFCSSSVSSGPVELVVGNQISHAILENSDITPSAPPEVLPHLEPSAIEVHDAAPPYSSISESKPTAPPSYNDALNLNADLPTETFNQPGTITTQGSYYDWSQSAFTYT